MEKSKIFNLLDCKLLHKWKNEIEEAESDSWSYKRAKEVFNALETALNEQERKLLNEYALAIENKLDYIYFNLKIKVLNFGIKIGMELDQSFAAFEE